jgi:hypothetical protein
LTYQSVTTRSLERFGFRLVLGWFRFGLPRKTIPALNQNKQNLNIKIASVLGWLSGEANPVRLAGA